MHASRISLCQGQAGVPGCLTEGRGGQGVEAPEALVDAKGGLALVVATAVDESRGARPVHHGMGLLQTRTKVEK